jgi:hypothetical protein
LAARETPAFQVVSRGRALTFPYIVEAEFLRPDPDHSPTVEQDDAHGYSVEHGFRREAEAFLYLPEGENAHGLGCYANDEQIRKIQSVVGHN